MLLLKDEDDQRVLTISMTLDALEATHREITKGDAATMGRIDVYLPRDTPDSFFRWAVMTGGGTEGTGLLWPVCCLTS